MTTTTLGLINSVENTLQPGLAHNANMGLLNSMIGGNVTREFAADANITLVAAEYQTSCLVFTDSPSTLTAGRDVVFPANFPHVYVKNNTAQTLTLKKTGQAGVTLAAGSDGIFISGATDVQRASGGSGTVASVNGATGAVVLDDGDVKSVVTALTSGTTVTVDCSLGRNFTITLGHNVATLTLSNLAGSGYVTEIEIEVKQPASGGPYTFALPASFKALGGSDTAIASAANAVTVLSAKTFDNGTTWRYAMQESA